jgi:prepilin-type N-terminal cleavage/methylation domain-containing protein
MSILRSKMRKNNKNQKGFTLIELLIVIAIIAILAVVVVLTLNPAQLLAQARDSNRISDFATLKSAIALYQTDVATTTQLGTSTIIVLSESSTSLTATSSSLLGSAGWGFTGETSVATGTRVNTGTGAWVTINFSLISSGAPIGALPVDPVNSGSNTYAFVGATSTYKLATKMESTKYQSGGAGDVTTNDGGNSTSTYEQGSNLTGL